MVETKIFDLAKAEKKILNQSESLANIIEALPYIFYIIDVNDYTIKASNSPGIFQSSDKITCYAHAYGSNKPCDGKDHPCPLERVKKTKAPAIVKHIHYDQEGKARNVEIYCSPIFDEEGNVVQVIEYSMNVTELMLAEEALQEKDHDLGKRIKELNCLYGISALVEKSEILLKEIFQGTVDLIPLGWQYPEITCARITVEGQEFTTVDFKESEWMQSSDIRVHGQCVGSLEVGYLEKRPESDEGPFLKEERYLIDAIVLRLGHIIERKWAEEALRASENKYKTLLENLPQKIFFKDKDSIYVSCNENYAKDLKIKSDEIAGMTDFDFYPKKLAEKYRADDNRIIESGKTQEIEEKYIQDGKEFIIQTVKTPIRDENGNAVGILGVFWDITEQHHNRDQLIQSDKLAAIGTLAAGVAHEMNNPIGYINSNLNTMAKYLKKINKYFNEIGLNDTEEHQSIKEIMTDFDDAINESIEGTSRVKKIVADLKSFSRVDRAQKEFAHINEGIESTLNIVWNELKYKCKVEKEYGDLPDLYCIPNQLNQVFMNLLLNAGQAITDKSGLIKIKTWADDGNIFISIKDNGQGIPEENLKKIFEPFFTTKEVGKGTGLGLSLVFDIIKKHNGKIVVNSEVGVGTEFIITLPLEGIGDA